MKDEYRTAASSWAPVCSRVPYASVVTVRLLEDTRAIKRCVNPVFGVLCNLHGIDNDTIVTLLFKSNHELKLL